MKSYDELFNDRFHRSQEFDNKIYEILVKEGFEGVINYLKEIGATSFDITNYYIVSLISEWTKAASLLHEKDKILENLKKLEGYVIDAKVQTNSELNTPELVIETIRGVIRVSQFSTLVPDVKQVFPFIEEDERFGKCYDFAYTICLCLANLSNELVTGYIYGYCDKSKFLHSWVETTIKGKEYAIDGTINALVNKEGYYLMRYAEPITRINKLTLRRDAEIYMDKLEKVPLEVYYVFRDEIIKDLEKNQDLFKIK